MSVINIISDLVCTQNKAAWKEPNFLFLVQFYSGDNSAVSCHNYILHPHSQLTPWRKQWRVTSCVTAYSLLFHIELILEARISVFSCGYAITLQPMLDIVVSQGVPIRMYLSNVVVLVTRTRVTK